MQKTERWLKVNGFNGFYEVSNLGNVRSYKKHGNRLSRIPKLLSQHADKVGRKTVTLWKNNNSIKRRVHRMVLEAFIGECPNGMEACHNDGNASNNALENLRWDTHINNCNDRKNHGTERGLFIKGERKYAKLTAIDVIKIRELAKMLPQKKIAEMYPVGKTQISNIVIGKCWSNI